MKRFLWHYAEMIIAMVVGMFAVMLRRRAEYPVSHTRDTRREEVAR